MKIDLSQIESEPLRFRETIQLDPERVDADQVATPLEVTLEGAIRRAGDGFLVDGHVTAEGELRCVRCLEPVAWRISEGLNLQLVRTVPAEEDVELSDEDLEASFIDSEELDIEDLAAEQVSLGLPMHVVCDANCAGLCPSCGANLNHPDACECEPEADPRWAALADLKDRTS